MPKIMDEKELQSLLGLLIKEYRFIGPVRKDLETGFGEIKSLKELVKDYTNTIEPPKYLFLTPQETLFSYEMKKEEIAITKTEEQGHAALGDRPSLWSEGIAVEPLQGKAIQQVIFGVRPCDVHGIRMMDKVFKEDFDDTYYQSKRNKTIIFSVTCTSVSDYCFCQSWGTGPSLKDGFDLLLTDLGDRYLIETGSKEGNEIIGKMRLRDATPMELKQKAAVIKATEAKFTRKLNIKDIQQIMISQPEHPTWKDKADRCLSCGNCTSVCPTCYCFDVQEKGDYNPSNMERYRLWDSCQLLEYSQVALGGNFRRERISRLKQFMMHKLSFSYPQYGDFHCVGCGRCIKWCPTSIDLTEVAKDLRGE